MVISDMLKRFVKDSPVPVMARAVMNFAFPDTALDKLFVDHARSQYEDQLLFSTVIKVMGLVVSRERRSVNSAYEHVKEEASVSVQALYDKLKNTEPRVTRALIVESFRRLLPLVKRLNKNHRPLFPGYVTKILDGNHLTGTEHRILETRTLHSSPLPGQALVVLQPDEHLMSDLFPCEDAYAQERRLLNDVFLTVQPNDLWIADRNFCTTAVLFTLAERGAAFIIRQHASTLNGKELIGKRRRIGRTEAGIVYEQTMRITDPERGKEMLVRRITVVLDKPTVDGETEVHVLSNLPRRRFSAMRVAAGYLYRWRIENAFQELEQSLRGEINTLGYPRAALLGFSVAVLLYNIMSVLRVAIQSKHGEEAAFEKLSTYYLGEEITAIYGGMMIAVSSDEWTDTFGDCTAVQLAKFLQDTAGYIKPIRFRKHTRAPKKPPPKRKGGLREKHVSTYQLIEQRKEQLCSQ
jgi:IS4 transposase